MPEPNGPATGLHQSRRGFLRASITAAAAPIAARSLITEGAAAPAPVADPRALAAMTLNINARDHAVSIDVRTALHRCAAGASRTDRRQEGM